MQKIIIIGDSGSIPGSGGSPGGGNGNSLQYSCLKNPMANGARWATVHGVAESDTTERLHSLIPILVTFLYVISCSCRCTPKERFRDLWDFLALLRSHSNSLDE